MADFISLNRRRLLTLMALSPLLWQSRRALASPVNNQRVIALEWLPVELLMALGVAPMGVADLDNYRMWVGEPALPAATIDVGLRTEPNLELMTSLDPSLIIYSTGYGPAPENLARIAPTLGVSFSDGRHPLMMARQSLVELGSRLGREQAARQHLAQFDRFIATMKTRFASRGTRPVLLMSILDPRHALVVGKNSLFQQVMDQIGVTNAWQGEVNFWGTQVMGIEQLAAIKDADVLCFDHNNDAMMAQVIATPLWQAMPFVRAQRFKRVPPVWFYGATLSAMHFCTILNQALGGKV